MVDILGIHQVKGSFNRDNAMTKQETPIMMNGRMVTTCPMVGGAGVDIASVQTQEKGKENQEPVLFGYHYNKMPNACDIVSIMQEYNVGQNAIKQLYYYAI